ncbi:hypothetical protein VSS37_14100 [Candidatus Thiothrix sp. Deng01]|uniref:Uncharacterized protein n=1 Tax=Candidatus Thiothrix phosphatis TaxID=3112415 RepID=A0ABU6CZ59_9GAMM|nr:hypothetical protein [Candidatus Thiothrix sp. Deng01]MEB4592120.1 hypothetical protein [Candidatus Thiothrix sp. Deng01]
MYDRLADATRTTDSGQGGFNLHYEHDRYGNLDYKSDAGDLVYDMLPLPRWILIAGRRNISVKTCRLSCSLENPIMPAVMEVTGIKSFLEL